MTESPGHRSRADDSRDGLGTVMSAINGSRMSAQHIGVKRTTSKRPEADVNRPEQRHHNRSAHRSDTQ